MTVLIVEDELDLAELLSLNLSQQGFTPAIVLTGADALGAARHHKPDLILLDVNLPDVSGIEVCRQLRADASLGALPVVMLTARGEEVDRVAGLEAGADDYVVKPFSVRELVLRLKAVLRRHDQAASKPTLQVGVLRLDQDSHRCFVGEQEVHLTVIEFRLLRQLMREPGVVQPREQLLAEVWGVSSELETRTIDTHVMRLREKLGAARGHVQTLRGVGYRMVDTVS